MPSCRAFLLAILPTLLAISAGACAGDDASGPPDGGVDAGDAGDGTDAGDGGETADGGDAGTSDTGCDELWTVSTSGTGSASIAGGALVLAADSIPAGSRAASVTQAGLTGDFTITARFEEFVAGGAGTGFAVTVVKSPQSGAGTILARPDGSGTSLGAIIVDASQVPLVDSLETAARAGTITIARAGDELTVTSTTSDATASVESVDLDAATLDLVIALANSHSSKAVASRSSVRLTAVELSGGGTRVKADAFECDSLK